MTCTCTHTNTEREKQPPLKMKDNPCYCQTHEKIIVADLVQGRKQKLQTHFSLIQWEVIGADYSHLDINFHTHLTRQVTTVTENNLRWNTEHSVFMGVCVSVSVHLCIWVRQALGRDSCMIDVLTSDMWYRCPHILPPPPPSLVLSSPFFKWPIFPNWCCHYGRPRLAIERRRPPIIFITIGRTEKMRARGRTEKKREMHRNVGWAAGCFW